MKLYSIRLDRWHRRVEVGLEVDAGDLKLPLQEDEDLLDGLVDMNVGEPRLRVAHQ